MAEMTRRQRILAAARRQETDKLPFFHWWRHMQDGFAEREARNRGMGVCWLRPAYVERLHNVEVVETRVVVEGRPVIRRTFNTPVGSVYEDEWRDPGVGQWKVNRSWRDVTPWQTSRRIKEPEDYQVVKYIVENTEYVADYFPIEQAMDWLGEDGVVVANLPHSPMQMLMIDWVGSEGGRFFYHLMDYPEVVEDLYRAISRSRERMYAISAQSPASIVMCGDNVDGFLAVPRIFEKYFLPEYEKEAALVHAAGKVMAVHMDGRLGALKDLIARSPVDIVEAFHPLPMGDLPLGEALAAWPNKAIWIGFPGSVYALGPQATRQRALELLSEAGSGERLALAASTENQVGNENLLTLSAIMEKAALPLSPDLIARIGQEVRQPA
ncbi:MAG: hypothetical protein M1401_06375 [Chloroflexi bacterium]|nr:hypothetical protein [Chloroflexota bacterium]